MGVLPGILRSYAYICILVLWRPRFVSIHPERASEVIDDGNAVVTLFCEANGFPRPAISWLKNNTPVTNATIYQNGSTSSLVLVFNEITEKPIKYRCIARNSQGSTLSKEATLIVTRSEATGRFRHVKEFLILAASNTSTPPT